MDGGYGDGEMFAVFILIMFSFCVFFSDEVLLKLTYICVIFVIDFFAGPCADGYGVCCLNFVTACQSNVKKNVSYIQAHFNYDTLPSS